MGNYYKFKEKASGVIRPVLPANFILTDGMLMWDDTDAVYDKGALEFSKNGEEWDTLGIFLPDEETVEALPGKYLYRMRVFYNSHWSVYLIASTYKAEVEPKAVVKKITKKKK